MSWNPALIDGPLTIPTYGPPDAEGVRQVVGTVPGYHLNVAPQCYTEDLESFRVDPDPATPFRVFAGAPTYFLRFADEDEAREYLPDYWLQ